MPLSQIVSASIEDGAVAPVDLSSVAQYTGFKNRFINAEMKIAQRGTSFSSPATATYTLDRWQIGVVGTPPASVAQVAGPAGFKNAIQFTGAVGNTATQLLQKIESFNCSDLSGQTITIQANISVSSSQTIAWFLFSAASADNWTSPNLLTSGTWSATSTPTTFTATITNLASSATNGLALYICANNNGPFTSGTFTVTGVQLEKGVTATSFDYRPYGTELALCQRYYQTIEGVGSTTGGTNNITYTFVTEMRATPTIGTVTQNTGTGISFANCSVSPTQGRRAIFQLANSSANAYFSVPLSSEL